MTSILNSMRLDNYILRGYYKVFALVYVIAILIGIITKIPVITVAIVVVISAPFIGTYFSVHEKNNLNKLYGVLPLGRSKVVLGRYSFALIFGIINGIVPGILAYLISLFVKNGMSHLEILAILSASFAYFCLFIAVQFPIYFKFGFAKVYIFSNLPFYLVFLLGAFVLKRTDILKQLGQVVQYFSSHQNMIWVTGLGSGLILLIISCLLSYWIYRNKEL
jgi:ABC-2 family transporter protein